MLVYVYDSSFEGLLTAIYDAFYNKQKPDGLADSKYLQVNLLDEYVYINTDYEKSNKVYNSIRKKISSQALRLVYNIFLSETQEAGTIIFEYLKLGWKLGRDVDLHLADDRVLKVHKLSRKVECENHNMMGFLRFRLIEDNIYYAPIRPDNNIAALLAPHFADRMSDQRWIIHDVRRGLAAIYNLSKWVLAEVDSKDLEGLEEKDTEYQELWKEFFKTIAIPGRINPKLQKRLMPVRYWRYLPEK